VRGRCPGPLDERGMILHILIYIININISMDCPELVS
jgi:hypothetical protein